MQLQLQAHDQGKLLRLELDMMVRPSWTGAMSLLNLNHPRFSLEASQWNLCPLGWFWHDPLMSDGTKMHDARVMQQDVWFCDKAHNSNKWCRKITTYCTSIDHHVHGRCLSWYPSLCRRIIASKRSKSNRFIAGWIHVVDRDRRLWRIWFGLTKLSQFYSRMCRGFIISVTINRS